MRSRIELLNKAVQLHSMRDERNARLAVLQNQKNIADAEHGVTSAEQSLVLNNVLCAKRQEAIANGGMVTLDMAAIYTGRIATLGQRMKQLTRLSDDWAAAIEKHNTETQRECANA